MRELQQLHGIALANGGSMVCCKWMYRNKPLQYFRDIEINHGNIMQPYIKDNNGDPASIINGQINGLFFSSVVDRNTGGPMPFSYFGERRLLVPATHFFQNLSVRLYFADFYCLNYNAPHYVTLVMTERGSQTDRFCDGKLMELDIHNNSFLYYNQHQQNVWTCNTARVEVLYTEDIDLTIWTRYHGCQLTLTPTRGRGTSTPGGFPKRSICHVCNL